MAVLTPTVLRSVHVLLSVMKGRGFIVRDARLRTHDLEWRNRTWSFEELIGQFIPSDPSWRGWVKVALQQPVFSVGGVVKELITKTQWGRMGKSPDDGVDSPPSSSRQVTGYSTEDRVPLSRSFPESLHSRDVVTTPRSDSGSAVSSEAISVSDSPRRRTNSMTKPRRSNLFRRTGPRKSSVDSAESSKNAPS